MPTFQQKPALMSQWQERIRNSGRSWDIPHQYCHKVMLEYPILEETTHCLPQFCTWAKRIQTLQSLFRGFGAERTFTLFTPRWSGSIVQVWVQDLAPLLSSGYHLERLFQKTIKGFDCKINGQALEAILQHSCKHRELPSWLQSLSVATGLLEKKVLPLLLYWLGSRVKKVLNVCKFYFDYTTCPRKGIFQIPIEQHSYSVTSESWNSDSQEWTLDLISGMILNQ